MEKEMKKAKYKRQEEKERLCRIPEGEGRRREGERRRRRGRRRSREEGEEEGKEAKRKRWGEG